MVESMAWIRKHWVALLSAIPLLPAFLKSIKWLLELLGDADFVVSRWQNPGWVGKMLGALSSLPEPLNLALIFAGLGLIWWDARRLARQPRAINGKAHQNDALARALARRLDEFFVEGTDSRNELQKGDVDLTKDEHDAGLAAVAQWSNKVVEAMDDSIISVASISRFRTLNEFAYFKRFMNQPNRSHLAAVWSEKLKRLRTIIDRLGA